MDGLAGVAHAMESTEPGAVGLPDSQASQIQLAVMGVEAAAHHAGIKAQRKPHRCTLPLAVDFLFHDLE